MILQSVPVSVRGELTRWLLEPYPGVFIGKVSRRVRELLWEKVCKSKKFGGAVQIWSTNNEQGYSIEMCGNTKRQVIDFEGLKLIVKSGK